MKHYTVLTRPGMRCLALAALAATLSACAGQPASAPSASRPASEATQTSAAAGKTGSAKADKKTRKAPPRANASDIRKGIEYEYTVKRGDTLWDIASYFLKSPWKWPEIWYRNPHVHNPHWIYPGDVLKLRYVNGHPQLSVARRVVRLSPHVRIQPLENAIPVVPEPVIRAFMRGPRIVDEQTLEHAPYVLSFANGEILGASGMDVYVRHLSSHSPGTLAVVRPGRIYRDPQTGEVLGREVDHLADAELVKRSHPATLKLVDSLRETHVGDLLLPEPHRSLADFYPRAPSKAVSGQIIGSYRNFREIGRYQIVTLDRGARNGLKRGDVLKIEQRGRRVPDPYGHDMVQLPERDAGLVMVFRAYPKLSYALVMRTKRPVHVGDRVHSPQRSPD